LAADIFGKICQGLSEVFMSLLLIVLASGWTVTYSEIDIDDGGEIYLPIGSFILIFQILIAAFTFIDIDASHKYHDFAGIQGWVLFTVKLLTYLFFVYKLRKTAKSGVA